MEKPATSKTTAIKIIFRLPINIFFKNNMLKYFSVILHGFAVFRCDGDYNYSPLLCRNFSSLVITRDLSLKTSTSLIAYVVSMCLHCMRWTSKQQPIQMPCARGYFYWVSNPTIPALLSTGGKKRKEKKRIVLYIFLHICFEFNQRKPKFLILLFMFIVASSKMGIFMQTSVIIFPMPARNRSWWEFLSVQHLKPC